jgi:hypothetical protein
MFARSKAKAPPKPRILAALLPVRSDVASSTRGSPTQESRRAIPESQVDRIRTWLRYGMTARQAPKPVVCRYPNSKMLFDCAAIGDADGETVRLARS